MSMNREDKYHNHSCYQIPGPISCIIVSAATKKPSVGINLVTGDAKTVHTLMLRLRTSQWQQKL